jgi:hypothetical protein
MPHALKDAEECIKKDPEFIKGCVVPDLFASTVGGGDELCVCVCVCVSVSE